MTIQEQLKVYLHHLDFYKAFWRRQTPLYVGLHTIAICDAIDEAVRDFDNGKSSFLILTVPPRHGKSDLVSRFLTAHFIGSHPDCDVMLVSYNASLAQTFSRDARTIVKEPLFKTIFRQELSMESASVDQWKLKGRHGTITASGLMSGITGKGAHLLILDDFCAGRADAESVTMRNKTWECFSDDFFTRRAPTAITVIIATAWHVDDIIARIKRKNDPNDENFDENFPFFKVLKFPAKNGVVEVTIAGETRRVEYDYLFTDKKVGDTVLEGRFTEDYYAQQFAVLGEYSAQSLMQCEPRVRGGNLINTSRIVIHDSASDFPSNIQYIRVWDLAHTAKQTQKDDPDYTSGTLLAYQKINGVYHLWIKDVARIRARATERNNFILAVAEKDGTGVRNIIENSSDAKDAVDDMQAILKGKRTVKPINIKYDKVVRVSYVEPIFDAGNVHLLRGTWNRDWLEEVAAFPNGKHDDQVDNVTAGYFEQCQAAKITYGKVRGV